MNKEENNEYWLSLILDRITDSLNENKNQELDNWIALSDENRKSYDEILAIWDSMDITAQSNRYDKEKAYALFKKRIQKKFKLSIRHALTYAASIAILLSAGYYGYSSFFGKNNLAEEATFISKIVVPNGSIVQTELNDGTKLWINAGSSVHIAPDFGKKERRIVLSGEAYLEVTKSDKIPFIVETEHTNVRVHGTKFNIDAYHDDGEVKVALLEGSVELETEPQKSTYLKPNELAIYDKASQTLLIERKAIEGASAWTSNHLIFKDIPFSKIIIDLERHFNIKINIYNDSIADSRSVGDFVSNESLEQILKVMSSNGKFTYTISADRKTVDIY